MKDCQEFYITLNNLSSYDNVFSGILIKLEKEGVLLNKIVFFGDILIIKEFISVVRGKYPFSIVGSSSPGGKISVYIAGIKIINGESQKVEFDGEILGRYFDLPNLKYLNIAGVCLINKNDIFKKEAEGEYVKIAKILTRYGFSSHDIYRFWNYMGAILENYPVFNKVRNAYFFKNNIIKFPAATGVEASLGFGKKISVGFEAIMLKKDTKFKWKTIKSDLQCEAFEYEKKVSGMSIGPKFSRAIKLVFPESQMDKIYISGISSANREGKSLLGDNPRENVAYVMDSFENLLKKNGFSLDNIVSSHTYFKSREILSEFEMLYTSKNWKFPYNSVVTNICRKNFLFEIEGVAVNGKILDKSL